MPSWMGRKRLTLSRIARYCTSKVPTRGLGFRVKGLGFGVKGLGFGVWFEVWGFQVVSVGLGVTGLGFSLGPYKQWVRGPRWTSSRRLPGKRLGTPCRLPWIASLNPKPYKP